MLGPSQARCTSTRPIIRARVGFRAAYLQSLRAGPIRVKLDRIFRVKMTFSPETEVPPSFTKIRQRVFFLLSQYDLQICFWALSF